jgi:uncharacterized membrane protein YbaN (DUF454 family)
VARAIYTILGLLFVALGVVGAFVPIIPTVSPLLAAVFFFSRSHPAWAERLYAHPKYGPSLRKWRDDKAIGRKAKISAVAAMVLSAGITWFTVGWPGAAVVSAILACVAAWIWTRPE